MRDPSATNGRVIRSEIDGKISASPNRASSTSATQRPASFARTAQLPPTAASVATPAKVSAIPTSIGSAPRTKLRPALAKTKGSTGRMHGLTIVSIPPKNARSAISTWRSGRAERQGQAVHAIAKARRARAIIDDVAKMPAAAAAQHFRPDHAEGHVAVSDD